MPTLSMDNHMKSPSASFPSLTLLSFLFLLLGFFAFSQSTPLAGNVSYSDEQALLQFKAALTFHPNNSLADWTRNTSFCKWAGITCSPPPMQSRVVGINLSSMGLEGTISPVLGNLSALQSLDLCCNALRGHIPPQLGQLSHMKELRLSANQLEGNIPPSLGRCSSLVNLKLSYNLLQGSIPQELGFLRRLEVLSLGDNNLNGIIPSSIGNLFSVVELYLSTNNLTGIIPYEVGMLTNLQVVYLHTNELSGTIPSSIANLSSLIELDLGSNNLRGTIPDEIAMLTNLEILFLHANELSGTIPSSIVNLSSLVALQLQINNLTGTIPHEIGMLTQLEILYIRYNELSGTIPSSIGNLSSLVVFELSKNNVTGTIPWELCNKLNNIKTFHLGYNMLIGEIPNSIGNCTNLKYLHLDNNLLSGMVPIELGKLRFLEAIGLSGNKIGGHIPQEITNLTYLRKLLFNDNLLSGHIPPRFGRLHKLERLDLSSNIFEGRIPEEIGQMQSLWLLDVSYNRLSGRIPASLGRLGELRRIFLNNNHFTGEIPSSLETVPNVELLDLSHNNLTGSIPGEVMASLKNLQFYLDLSCNFLQGRLPEEMSKIVSAQEIDVSSNRLVGKIPAVMENCISLVYLNLSHNIFQGPIPGALSKLPYLEDIDLSFNNLSGSIPMPFKQMKKLRYLNVSFNNLSGEVGEELFLNNTIVVLFMGNPGLCGPRKHFLPACAKPGQGKKLALRNKIGIAAGVIAFIVFSSVLALIWRRKFSRQQPNISNLMFVKTGYPKFSYQDIVIATNGFNEESLLGTGNFGSVYKGTLQDGRVVAIKVLHMQNKEGERSFKTECKVLGRIRHRNVIRVISACSYLNFKALVLQFACNGSLEKHLYPERNEEDSSRLELGEWLNIAIDVAHGMEYLHHDCFTQVVHCDLKPSNVLLDADMTALVSDFGISRLTNFADFMDSLGTTCAARGTIGYIAPEYGLGENISIKGDVYSYGILLLEMVTRKRPTDTMFVGDLNLRSWVRSAYPNSLVDVVDNQLLRNLTVEQHRCLISFIHVGLLCSHVSPQDRPTMRDVGRALESLRATFMGSATATSYLSTPILDLVSVPSTSRAPDEADSQSSSF